MRTVCRPRRTVAGLLSAAAPPSIRFVSAIQVHDHSVQERAEGLLRPRRAATTVCSCCPSPPSL